MTDITINGMNIASSVVETIVSLAARDVEGVACIGSAATSGLRSLVPGKPSTQGIQIEVDENDQLCISVRMDVKNGYVLPDVAAKVRQSIADAVATQIGAKVGSVDIFIDGIQFAN